jgi:hypothetical protein
MIDNVEMLLLNQNENDKSGVECVDDDVDQSIIIELEDNLSNVNNKQENESNRKKSVADVELGCVMNHFMCRICHCEEVSEDCLLTPCYCSGTLRYVHQVCLQRWLRSKGNSIESK